MNMVFCQNIVFTARTVRHVKSIARSCSYGASQTDLQAEERIKPFEDIPGPPGLPYLGTLLDYKFGKFKNIEKYNETVLSLHAKYGKIVRQTMTGTTRVHIFDPEYVKAVYQYEGKNPFVAPLLETIQLYRQKRDLSPGLGNINGEEWYRLRHSVQQMMMRPTEVTVFLPYVNQIADEFVDKIGRERDRNNEVDDFTNEIAKWSLESSGMTGFEKRLGYMDVGKEEGQKMVDASFKIFKRSTKLKFSLPLFKYMMTPAWKTIIESEDYFFGNVKKYVEETALKIQTLIDKGEMAEDKYVFLAYLLSRKELSLDDVSIITLSLLADGLVTTVPTLLFCLYSLATNPHIQQKLYEEIRAVVPAEGEVTSEMINNLPYLKACVKENFRFFPNNLDVSRIPQKDIVIGGYHIPAGTLIELNNFVMLKKPEYFKDPEKFIPERWLRSDTTHKDENMHPFVFIPFGHGPRMCSGRRISEQELYVMLIKLLQRYKIEWHHEPMRQKYRILMFPDCATRYTFIDRK